MQLDVCTFLDLLWEALLEKMCSWALLKKSIQSPDLFATFLVKNVTSYILVKIKKWPKSFDQGL